MKLKCWIVDAPGGGCCMQVLERDGIKPELLRDGVFAAHLPSGLNNKIYLDITDAEYYRNRTAQSIIDQLTTGLAGHGEAKEPKLGDRVKVLQSGQERESDRIFLCSEDGADRPYICVDATQEDEYHAGEGFVVHRWGIMRPIPQPVRYSREGDIHTWATEAE